MLWRPEAYHGDRKKGSFFEGWFFKIVDETKENIYAFIPGISLGDDPHGFIQMLDGQSHHSAYTRFPVEDFQASTKKLMIRIGSSVFTEKFLELNISTDEQRISGKIEFGQLKPWPVTLTSPGAMGWYAFMPFMECFHGVLSFDNTIKGSLLLDNKKISFDKGKGYIEKDWGQSFPNAYVWIQSNHFKQPGVSLMVSVAKITWLTGDFRGFIIGLLLDGKLYRFATYTGAQLHYLKLSDSQVQLAVSDRNFLLNIEALRTEGGLLHAPYQMTMMQRVSETLKSQVKVELYDIYKNKKNLIFSDDGNPAGLDVNGKLEEIVNV